MRQRIGILLRTFLYFIFLFLIHKVAFFFACKGNEDFSFGDCLSSIWHGVPLDLSTAGYLTALPLLLVILSIWIVPQVIKGVFNVYFALLSFVYVIVALADIVLYPYWGFHFDSSIFLYLASPKDAMASATTAQTIVCSVLLVLFTVLMYWGYRKLIATQISKLDVPKSRLKTFGVSLLIGGLLFLCIRGGVTTSTMNVGRVYFSDTMFLNHAAINPHFNLLYSATKTKRYDKQYQFYDRAKSELVFTKMHEVSSTDSIPSVLKADRPNIVFFILESFSGNVFADTTAMPNLNKLANEGVYFSNFYANSFRTDRGVVSILGGYPTQPTAAIMKYPNKTQSLPSISKKLLDNGYDLSFYYGGDVDFASMRSYYVGSCGIKDIVADKEFPMSERLTKWGVRDDKLFERAFTDIEKNKDSGKPFMTTILTLSSHEPFDVPTKKFDEPFLNSVAYTDSCIGVFTDKLRATELWDNTLLVFVADHCMQSYPQGVSNYEPTRFQIPLVWAGGAVKEPLVVDEFSSQNDIAATLLSQLKINHSDFKFSKDILNPDAPKFAFYSYVNGFSILTKEGRYMYDNTQNSVLVQEGDSTLETKAKSYFQNMYLDLGER